MSENSKIEWCDATFNPWEGCTKIGPGCDHCYAEARNARFGGGTAPNWGPGAPRRRTSPANWRKPIAWNAAHAEFFATHGRRQRVFCASLADVFDNEVDQEWRDDLWQLIHATPDLDWLLLTKRIGNAIGMLPGDPDIYPNVWLGATIVNQEEADRDIPKLLGTPAAVRFLSMEPLLGAVDISRFLDPVGIHCMDVCPDSSYVSEKAVELAEGGDEPVPLCPHCGLVASWTGYDVGIDWVIVGGESGAGARPMSIQWARSLRDQCKGAGVPFLFKQWGEWSPAGSYPSEAPGRFAFGDYEHDPAHFVQTGHYPRQFTKFGARSVVERVGKRAAGRELDGVTHDGFPGGAS